MSKNHYWVLLLKGEEPELFTSWPECEKKKRGASRAIDHGFSTEKEAAEFIAGKWRVNLMVLGLSFYVMGRQRRFMEAGKKRSWLIKDVLPGSCWPAWRR